MRQIEELVDRIEDLRVDLRLTGKWNRIAVAIEVVSRIEGKPRKPRRVLRDQSPEETKRKRGVK